jgi:hypothetical protein
MFVYNLLSVALAFLWSALAVSCAYIKNPCSNPVVRQEWRALSTDEKAEWIRAVDVRIDDGLTLIILLKHIRNPVLESTAS